MQNDFFPSFDLKMRYLQRKSDEVVLCLAEVEGRNFEKTKIMAHQMKGNARNFEFPLLEQLGILLEESALSGNPIQTKEILEDIRQAVSGFVNRLTKLEVTSN